MGLFLWSEYSKQRNQLTEKFEPIQPYLFIGFLKFAGASKVLDVGANIGYYSIWCSVLEKVEKIYSFEPDLDAFNELKKNIDLNSVEKLVSAKMLAVTDYNGTAKFSAHAPMSGINGIIETSIHDPDLFQYETEVECITLDSIDVLDGEVIGLKVDVEGHELNVLRGAKKLLSSSPSVIQIENFGNVDLHETLRSLGYFNFFSAGHDAYFTNIRNFQDPIFVKRAVEYATTLFIEVKSERPPELKTITSALDVNVIADDKIYVTAQLTPSFFKVPEFAFYLLGDGKKIEEQWYQSDNQVSFVYPKDKATIEVQAFVRETGNNDKKIVVGKFIKKSSKVGYRPPSAVDNAEGLPSFFTREVNRLRKEKIGYPSLDISLLLDDIKSNSPEQVLMIGCGYTFEKLVDCAATYQRISFTLLTNDESLVGIAVNDVNNRNDKELSTFNVSCKYVENSDDFLEALLNTVKAQPTSCLLVLADQFLTDIGCGIEAFVKNIKLLPSGSKLYVSEAVNRSYFKQRACAVRDSELELIELPFKSELKGLDSKTTHNQERKNNQAISNSEISVSSLLDFTIDRLLP